MAEAPKKRPGRPRKSPIERQEQFSIRLPLPGRLKLEVIARSRNESLSQAVERAIDVASRVIEVPQEAGQSVEQSLQDGRSRLVHGFIDKFVHRDSFGMVSTVVMMEKNPLSYRCLVLPQSLHTPGETFFHQLLKALVADTKNLNFVKTCIEKGYLDLVLQSCEEAAGIGFKFDDYSEEAGGNSSAFALEWVSKVIDERG